MNTADALAAVMAEDWKLHSLARSRSGTWFAQLVRGDKELPLVGEGKSAGAALDDVLLRLAREPAPAATRALMATAALPTPVGEVQVSRGKAAAESLL
jgi:hypothetical protein